jgi:hypothetical protein
MILIEQGEKEKDTSEKPEHINQTLSPGPTKL